MLCAGTSVLKKRSLNAVVVVLAAAIVVCFFFTWSQLQGEKRGIVASIERRYNKQLSKLAEYAYNYDHVYDTDRPDSEKIQWLFGDPAIVEAAIYSTIFTNKAGIGIKPRKSGLPAMSCVCRSFPSIGVPVANLWCGDGRQFVEYSGCVVDKSGVERSYTIVFEVSVCTDDAL